MKNTLCNPFVYKFEVTMHGSSDTFEIENEIMYVEKLSCLQKISASVALHALTCPKHMAQQCTGLLPRLVSCWNSCLSTYWTFPSSFRSTYIFCRLCTSCYNVTMFGCAVRSHTRWQKSRLAAWFCYQICVIFHAIRI